ncbi:MAG TPA: YggT family protein [Gemmatimonadales bacterium]|nr:YggT family protein [Gemmatimonadales bacterium]
MPLAPLRYAVFVAFVVCTLIAIAAWGVRTRRVAPFSSLGRTVRQLTDPIIRPIERWIVGRGGNPQAAPWWLVGFAVVGGILVISVTEWIAFQATRVAAASRGGPREVVKLLVYYAGWLVMVAILIRVIGSWFGAFRYSRWMRPVYVLTDWIIEPLRRIVPRFGMIDITPIVAWFLIQIVLAWLMRVL